MQEGFWKQDLSHQAASADEGSEEQIHWAEKSTPLLGRRNRPLEPDDGSDEGSLALHTAGIKSKRGRLGQPIVADIVTLD